MRRLDGITDSMDMGLGGLQEFVMDRDACMLWFMGLQRVRHNWVTELDWTELNLITVYPCLLQNSQYFLQLKFWVEF